jgi:predicted glycosyltransferase
VGQDHHGRPRDGIYDVFVGGLRFMLYSHDGLGLGHTRRSLAIAAAITELEDTASVLVVSGCREVDKLGLAPRVDVLRVPGLRKLESGAYAARRLPISGSRLRDLRAAQIASAVEGFEPEVMLVDKHPLGVREELVPALERLRARGGRAVLGLRDILDDPAAVREEWEAASTCEAIERHYELVLVYGSPHVLDLAQAYEVPPSVAELMRYTGYVMHPHSTASAPPGVSPFARGPRQRPVVLATTGGGEDGRHLLETFVEAARWAPWDGAIVTGPQLNDADKHSLCRRAHEVGVEFHDFAHDLAAWLGEFDALVCMGGYNTLCEAVSHGLPTVCVPRVFPRTEQLIRARSLAGFGLLQLLEPRDLEPAALSRAVATALASARGEGRAGPGLDLAGAWRSADSLLELASRVAAARAGESAATEGAPSARRLAQAAV